ncbi:MAG: class II glutamine amidotransferase [Erysipelotrichaceae bacterium]|nr:class II glutamine amidotransferase [Erysipelotrichaceae bacterium]
MCELFGLTSKTKKNIIPYLIEFYTHSEEHPHGWGLAQFKNGSYNMQNEAQCANDSQLLPHVIKEMRPIRLMIAHIRKASVGRVHINNTHPFIANDAKGNTWVLAHNGTIFNGDDLGQYFNSQRGETDSERILLYLVDIINQTDGDFDHINNAIKAICDGNKVNLLFTDGERLYVHTNMPETLFFKKYDRESYMIATVPLDDGNWQQVPLNRLLVYQNGKKIYEGQPHQYTYLPREEIPWDKILKHVTADITVQENILDQEIYHKYFIPTQRTATDVSGVEFEFPIVNLNSQPVDFEIVHELTEKFVEEFGFDHIKRDDNGHIYNSFSSLYGDDLSYDCSYNTLELSFGKEYDLNLIYDRFVKYYTFIQSELKKHQHTLTGMGINPHYHINKTEPVASERYRMLYHHLTSYKKYPPVIPFHDYANFGMFACSSQIQLDVNKDDVARTLNIMNRLEPLKTILFANSYLNDNGLEYLNVRDHLWKHSLHGYNQHNVDMYDGTFHDNQEVVSYIKSMSLYCVERGGKYINFHPMTLRQYFSQAEINGEYFDGNEYRSITFHPLLEDLQFLRSFKFEDLTFRGTIEYRSICQQPVSDIMAPSAFHVGLNHKLDELEKLLDEDQALYHQGFTVIELRTMLNMKDWPPFLNREKISKLLIQVLDLAKEGLVQRGLNEERFLTPLYERAQTLQSPARVMIEAIDHGATIDDYILKYSEL